MLNLCTVTSSTSASQQLKASENTSVHLHYSTYDKLIFSLSYFGATEDIKDLLKRTPQGLFLIYFTEKYQQISLSLFKRESVVEI